jgi:hypothetical protein
LEHFGHGQKTQDKGGQQTQETAVSFVAAVPSFNALSRVPAVRAAVFPPWVQLQYP